MERFAQKWAYQIANIRARWQWIGYALSGLAFIYLIGLLVYSGYQIRGIPWRDYLLPSLLAFILCLISHSCQFFLWTQIISSNHRAGWHDVAIYGRSMLMKRLPGGVWHWVGRTTLYSGMTDVSSRTILTASFLEWLLLLLVGGAISMAGIQELLLLRQVLFLSLIAISILLSYYWQPKTLSIFNRLFLSLSWVLLYATAWTLGGFMIQILTTPSGNTSLSWVTATWVWSVAGSISMLMIIIPAGLGIREITLTWLLQPYLPASQALIVSIAMRLIIMAADTIWGILGIAISYLMLQRQRPQSTLDNK